MKKSTLILVTFFIILKMQAQNYLINFAGAGATTEISNVKVDNLTSGATLTLNGGDILHLSGSVGIDKLNSAEGKIQIYPNPMSENSTLTFIVPETGNTDITIYDLTGKAINHTSSQLTPGTHCFRVTGLGKGIYLIKVSGNGYAYTSKLLSQSNQNRVAGIEYVSSVLNTTDNSFKSTSSTIEMLYKNGDRLLYKGISGIYSTIVPDVPVGNKTITFNFVACTDKGNNYYTVVKIGTQTWMAENLKTITFKNGTSIPLVSDATAWQNLDTPGYCWYANDEAANKDIFGALYNWYAVSTSNLAPAGWHVPTDAEWATLSSYLGGDNFSGGKLRESGFANWAVPNNGATNESGFTALPGGYRGWNGTDTGLGSYGSFWSATEYSATNAWWRALSYSFNGFGRDNIQKQSGFSIRCIQDIAVVPVAPTLTTAEVKNIEQNTATSGGIITSDGGAPISVSGVCWNTTGSPTTDDNKTTDGTASGTFTSNLAGLKAKTIYFIRAYATNSVGTSYGDQVTFTTRPVGETVSDINGNIYHTVTIGTQTWMIENLRSTKYNDGTSIPLVTDNTVWSGLITPGYCWYYNDSATYNPTYGVLYNWHAVNTAKLAPSGWHVATDEDWATLTDFIGGLPAAGGKLKETGTTHWVTPNAGATDEYGFWALPGGERFSSGDYSSIGTYGMWWSSTANNATTAWYRYITNNAANVNRLNGTKGIGLSVKCVKD